LKICSEPHLSHRRADLKTADPLAPHRKKEPV